MHKLTISRLRLSTLTIIILSIVTIGLVICTALLGAKMRILWSAHNSDLSLVKSMLRDANEATYRPVTIEPKEKRQYIYEASVHFPAAVQQADNFRYSYYAAGSDMKEQIVIASDRSLSAAYSTLGSEIFKNMPQYQRCSKEFIVQFAEGTSQAEFKVATTKPLADGRTAYLYKNTTCDTLFGSNNVDISMHQRTLEAIESY